MCRSDLEPVVHERMARLLADLRDALLVEARLPLGSPVVIGPVDFGDPDAGHGG